MEGRTKGPTITIGGSNPRTQGQAQPKGGSLSESNSLQNNSLLFQYTDELTCLQKGKKRLLNDEDSTKTLGILQQKAVEQAINALQQYRDIHSLKVEEYRRRSSGKDNWYKDWLPAVLQQQQQLERALALTKDTAQRTPNFSI